MFEFGLEKGILYVEDRNFEKLEQEFNFRTPRGEAYGWDEEIYFHQKTLILFLGKVKKCGSEGTMF